MTNPSGLVQQLLETVQRRMESKVLDRLGSGGSARISSLIDDVYAEVQAELESRATEAETGGETVQAEMYRLIRSDLLPQAVAALRGQTTDALTRSSIPSKRRCRRCAGRSADRD